MSIVKWFKNLVQKPIVIQAPPSVFVEPTGDGPELPDPMSTGKLRLGIIVGHTKDSPGATLAGSNGQCEYQFNKIIASKIEQYAKNAYKNVSVVTIFRDGVGISGAYARARAELCDAVIELHFNAFNGTVAGTETLCTPDLSDQAFAQTVQKAMCRLFQRKGDSRGVKAISKSDRGGGNVHAFPGGVNCLVEPFFGDNDAEAKMAVRLSDDYAACLVDAVALWGRQNDLLK